MFSFTATTSHEAADFRLMTLVPVMVERHNKATARLFRALNRLSRQQVLDEARYAIEQVEEFNRTADELCGEVMHWDCLHDRQFVGYMMKFIYKRENTAAKYECQAFGSTQLALRA